MKKLTVTKETLAPLNPEQSEAVNGGYYSQACTRNYTCYCPSASVCGCSTNWPHGYPC